jgi:hypothetical protein
MILRRKNIILREEPVPMPLGLTQMLCGMAWNQFRTSAGKDWQNFDHKRKFQNQRFYLIGVFNGSVVC